MTKQLIATTEIPASHPSRIEPFYQIHSVADGLYLLGGLLAPVIAIGIKKLLQVELKRRNAALEEEIKRKDADRAERAAYIKHLEGMVSTLMGEVSLLSDVLERSGDLNVKPEQATIQQRSQIPN